MLNLLNQTLSQIGSKLFNIYIYSKTLYKVLFSVGKVHNLLYANFALLLGGCGSILLFFHKP